MLRAPALRLTGLTKTYGTAAGPFEALDGVDLTIADGDFFGLLGPN
ncbi:MAG: ABC transporter ATP-binding protein, partial [Actinomycetota bacterium]|nr:ABC transporter ATP-binding protein [Actinomycetota bacterium]